MVTHKTLQWSTLGWKLIKVGLRDSVVVSFPRGKLPGFTMGNTRINIQKLSLFWSHDREFGRKIHLEKSEELIAELIFYNDNIQVGKKMIFYPKNGLTKVCGTLNILFGMTMVHLCHVHVSKRRLELVLIASFILDVYKPSSATYVKTAGTNGWK